MNALLPVVLALAAGGVQAQIYKCADAGGVRFAERPCGSSAILVSARAPSAAPPAADDRPVAPMGDAQRRQAALEQMTRDRMERERRFAVRDLEREIADEQARMGAALDLLRQRKRLANNNLAGAQWETSLSQEMQAVTARGNARIASLRADLAALRAKAQP